MHGRLRVDLLDMDAMLRVLRRLLQHIDLPSNPDLLFDPPASWLLAAALQRASRRSKARFARFGCWLGTALLSLPL